jgi:chromosome partitioning protein
MTIVVGFVSEKGGTGKTTACYHIAVALNRYHEHRVLVVDADYQRGGITGRFFPDLIETFGSGQKPGTTLFHKFQQLYSASTRSSNIDLRTWNRGGGSIDVAVADPRLSSVTVDKLPSTSNIRQNNQLLWEHMQTIDYVLDNLGSEYDYVLIDSHPEVSSGNATVAGVPSFVQSWWAHNDSNLGPAD